MNSTRLVVRSGRRFLYQSVSDNGISGRILDGTRPTRLLTADSQAQYAPAGWLLYVRQNTLFAQRFVADQPAFVGEARPLAEDVRTNEVTGPAAFIGRVLAARSPTR